MALDLLLTLPQAVLFAYIMRATVPMRRSALYCALSIFLSGGLYALGQHFPVPVRFVISILHLAVILSLPLFFTRERRGRTLLCAVVYTVACLSADILVSAVWMLRSTQSIESLQNHLELLALLKVLYLLVMGILMTLAFFILKTLFKHTEPVERGIPLIMLPLSQALVLDILLYVIQSSGEQPWKWMMMGLAAGCTILVDAVCAAALWKLRCNRALQEQLRLTERQLDNQLLYYRKLQDNIAQVNQIRHDLNNQLQTAYTLLERGEDESARSQLDTLHASLHQRVGTVYCDNPVADAVFSEKAQVCQEKNIRLEIHASLPKELPISGAHLCSLLSNLLDNAVEGCQNCTPAWIEFSAQLRAGCLSLTCRNTACVAEKHKHGDTGALLPQHGLGLGILRRVAQIYQGEVQVRRDAGIFLTTVLLPLSQAEPLSKQ